MGNNTKNIKVLGGLKKSDFLIALKYLSSSKTIFSPKKTFSVALIFQLIENMMNFKLKKFAKFFNFQKSKLVERGIEQGQKVTILGDLIWKSADSLPTLSQIRFLGKSKSEILKKLKKNMSNTSFYLAASSAVFLFFTIALLRRLQLMTFAKIKDVILGSRGCKKIKEPESEEVNSKHFVCLKC